MVEFGRFPAALLTDTSRRQTLTLPHPLKKLENSQMSPDCQPGKLFRGDALPLRIGSRRANGTQSKGLQRRRP